MIVADGIAKGWTQAPGDTRLMPVTDGNLCVHLVFGGPYLLLVSPEDNNFLPSRADLIGMELRYSPMGLYDFNDKVLPAATLTYEVVEATPTTPPYKEGYILELVPTGVSQTAVLPPVNADWKVRTEDELIEFPDKYKVEPYKGIQNLPTVEELLL